MITQINQNQKKQLMRQAHKLSPVVRIGNKKLSNALDIEIERALTAHELIKIKLPATTKPERQEIINTICKQHQAILVHAIGFVGTFYRPKAE